MRNLFNLLKDIGVKCLALTIAFAFLFSVTQANGHVYHKSHVQYEKVSFVAVMPDIVALPDRTVTDYLFPANDKKPVNTNYQLIHNRTLNLVFTQRNC